MEEVRLTTSEAYLYALIPVGIGFGLGLIPLIAGIIKKRVRLGVVGLLVSTVGGALLGMVLSIPAMAIFTWLAIRDGFVAEDALSVDGSDPEPPNNTSD
jgi:hypothetical protein